MVVKIDVIYAVENTVLRTQADLLGVYFGGSKMSKNGSLTCE
jgi:hypothetical protein